MSSRTKLGTEPKQWDLLMNLCITGMSDLASKRPHWKCYMADNTIHDGQKLKAVLAIFAAFGLYRRKNRIDNTFSEK